MTSPTLNSLRAQAARHRRQVGLTVGDPAGACDLRQDLGRHQYSSLGSIWAATRSTRMLIDDEDRARQDRHPLDDREVALQHGLDGEQADPGIVEDVLDDQHAAEQGADLHAEQVEHRHRRVAQHVTRQRSAAGGRPRTAAELDEGLLQRRRRPRPTERADEQAATSRPRSRLPAGSCRRSPDSRSTGSSCSLRGDDQRQHDREPEVRHRDEHRGDDRAPACPASARHRARRRCRAAPRSGSVNHQRQRRRAAACRARSSRSGR